MDKTTRTVNGKTYWPDADKDDDLYYSLDLTNFLQSGESIVSVTWEVPSAITKSSEEIVGNIVSVKLHTPKSGKNFKIVCDVDITGNGRSFSDDIPMYLNVY
jgi:hypothetical protein